MHPLLFQLGPIPVYSYGALIALGFLAALLVLRLLSPRQGLSFDQMVDLAFLSLVSGLLGARILFVFTLFNRFVSDPLAIFRIWEGGLVFYGGPIAAVPVAYWYTRKHRIDIWKVGDVFAPALVIGHFFGRLGCFAAGCCYGRPTDLPWGVIFHSGLVDPSLRGVPLHPTQLYEAFSLLVLFVGLLSVFLKKRFDGQVLLTYFMAYPVIRSLIETYRGDEIRGFVIPGILSTSQFISMIVFLIAGAAMIYRLKQVAQLRGEGAQT